jgi:putative lipoic acid-binding regulatory protein
MKIKLVGALPRQLRDMGLKAGDKFDASPAENTRYNAVRFKVMVGEEEQVATVYQENYKEI